MSKTPILKSCCSFTMALLMDWNKRNVLYRCTEKSIEFMQLRGQNHTIVPLPGSQILVNAGLWTGRPVYNTPVPRSESHQWTPLHFPTCCPSSGSSVSPSDGSGQSQAGTQEMQELLRQKRKERRGGWKSNYLIISKYIKHSSSLWNMTVFWFVCIYILLDKMWTFGDNSSNKRVNPLTQKAV